MHKRFFILALFMIFAPSLLMAGKSIKPKIEVIYPKKNQKVVAYDSTYILGNVTPGVTLTINKINIPVHPEGGFIAFLPIKSGEFVFHLEARVKKSKGTLDWPVVVPEPLKTVPRDSLAILHEFSRPMVYQELREGDLIELSMRGTPACSTYYMISGITDWKPMFESSSDVAIPGGETVFGARHKRDSILGSGVYQANMYVPRDCQVESTSVHFRLCQWKGKDSSHLAWTCIEDLADGRISVRQFASPQVVEMKDSVQTIRTGPRKGYLSVFQPKGVRFIADGKYDNYIRLQLAPGQTAWVPDTSIVFLPAGTSIPYSEVAYVQTFSLAKVTRLAVFLDEKLPFRVEEFPDENELLLSIYYCTSNTDWIRYDFDDSLIKFITWSQPQAGVYQLRIKLNTDQMWGYDAYYRGSILNLDIKKPPSHKIELKNLRIAIDAGHSVDPGAIGPTGYTEAEANLKISGYLAEILRSRGARVVMTRINNNKLELNERAAIAVRESCDLLISVHNNALPDGVNPFENKGVSTYYYQLQSKPLAEAIQSRLLKDLGMDDYGHYYSNLAVARPTQYLGVLVECTFIILPEEESRLKKEVYPRQCAEAIADGIADFLKGLK